jgi:hypothetical protein
MNIRCSLSSTALVAILVLTLCLLNVHVVAAETDQAGSKLQAAIDAFSSAFNAILGAEKAGANVSVILNQLHKVADLLAQAEIAYRNGDLNSAAAKADTVLSLSSDVKSSAQAAESAELASGRDALILTVGFSAGGCVVFALALFLVWRKIKRDYVKNMGDAKPEVIGQ